MVKSNLNLSGINSTFPLGTDRHNMLQMAKLDESFPLTNPSMWDGATVVWAANGHENELTPANVAVSMASSGYYQ